MDRAISSGRRAVPKQLAAHVFKPGHVKVPGSGMPRGGKTFSTILVQAAPKLAQRYVREALRGSAPLLQDTRKVFMPIESDSPTLPQPDLVVFLERLSPETPTLRMPPTDAETPALTTLPPTLSPSAGTVDTGP